MKIRATIFAVLCHVLLIHAAGIDDGAANGNFYNGFQSQSQFSNGGGSYQSSSGGLGGTLIRRRMGGDNGESNDYVSYSNPRIIIDGDYFSCGNLVCPADSDQCTVTSEAKIDDINKMRTVVECHDKSGKVLATKDFEEKNPYPNDTPPYSRHTTATLDGSFHSEDSRGSTMTSTNTMNKLSKEEQEKLHQTINQETRRINQQIQEQQQQFQHQMNEFQKNMQTQMRNTFGKGFPFGNDSPFGNNFPFGNNNNPFGPGFPFSNPHNYNYQPQNYVYHTQKDDHDSDDPYY